MLSLRDILALALVAGTFAAGPAANCSASALARAPKPRCANTTVQQREEGCWGILPHPDQDPVHLSVLGRRRARPARRRKAFEDVLATEYILVARFAPHVLASTSMAALTVGLR